MGKSLSQFAKSMRARADALPEDANRLAVVGTKAMLREMVEITPVDTSEAISNWQIGVGARSPSDLPPFFAGRRGSTRGASSDKAIAEGEVALGLKKPGQPVFLSNPAKHIADLDGGSSTQFAGGFVPRALIIFRQTVRAAVGKK